MLPPLHWLISISHLLQAHYQTTRAVVLGPQLATLSNYYREMAASLNNMTLCHYWLAGLTTEWSLHTGFTVAITQSKQRLHVHTGEDYQYHQTWDYVNTWTIKEPHLPYDYAKPPTAQDAFRPLPGLISREMGTAISCTECSQVAGFIQKLVETPQKHHLFVHRTHLLPLTLFYSCCAHKKTWYRRHDIYRCRLTVPTARRVFNTRVKVFVYNHN